MGFRNPTGLSIFVPMTQEILILDQHFVLHPSGSMFWKEKLTLLISDVHLGKVSHFRKYGAAVPQKAIHANFELLDQSVHFFKPEHIYFLGDLFHSYLNNEWKLFEEWVVKTASNITLIHGNHDIISPLKYEALGIRSIPEIATDGFLLTHHPEERGNLYNICGHIHPAVRIRGNGRQSLRFPCFFRGKAQFILPAFGEFTGTHTLKPKKNDEIYALVDAMVLKL